MIPVYTLTQLFQVVSSCRPAGPPESRESAAATVLTQGTQVHGTMLFNFSRFYSPQDGAGLSGAATTSAGAATAAWAAAAAAGGCIRLDAISKVLSILHILHIAHINIFYIFYTHTYYIY